MIYDPPMPVDENGDAKDARDPDPDPEEWFGSSTEDD